MERAPVPGGTDRPLIVRVSGLVAVSWGLDESLTATVKLKVPELVGVPDTTPDDKSKFKPDGREEPCPSDQVYGWTPPVADIWAEYGWPRSASDNFDVSIAKAPGVLTEILKFVVVVFIGLEESVTLTVKLNKPVFRGVPTIKPPVVTERPGGNEPEKTQLYGAWPPDAEIV